MPTKILETPANPPRNSASSAVIQSRSHLRYNVASLIFAFVAATMSILGCNTQSSSTTVTPSKPQTAKAKDATTPQVAKLDSVSASTAPSEPVLNYSAERLLLLTMHGPYLVELRFSVDGKSQRLEFDRAVESTMQAADTNGDGRATWDELSANKEFKDSEIGQQLPEANVDVTEYDNNQDGRVDREEAYRLLDDQPTLKAFTITSQPTELNTVPLAFDILDHDKNGVLDQQEFNKASETLDRYDSNDDDVLLTRELIGRQDADDAESMMTVSNNAQTIIPVLELHPEKKWTQNLFALKRLYGSRGRMRPTDFRATESLYTSLAPDGRLTEFKMMKMLQIEPHVSIAFDFGPGKNCVKLVSVDNHLSSRESITLSERQLTVDLGLARISFVIQTGKPAKLHRMQASIQFAEDQLLGAIDRDFNFRVTKDERQETAATLSQFDSGGDGQFGIEEIPSHIVLTAGPIPVGEQPSPVTAIDTDTLLVEIDAPEWFRFMDTNSDGSITAAEFLGDSSRFEQLDSNADRVIRPAEVK